MRILFLLLLFATGMAMQPVFAQNLVSDPFLKLWYPAPARAWEEALPLGNGKTGAMIFGGICNERYQLNDNTLWSGYPEPGNNPHAAALLPLVREQVFQSDFDSAGKIWKKMQGPYSARYLPLGDLNITFEGDTVVEQYNRQLNLHDATSVVRYSKGGKSFNRETFISYPDKVLVSRLTTDHAQGLNFKVQINSKLHYKVRKNKNGYLILSGKAPKYVANRDFEKPQIIYEDFPGGEGMTFEVDVNIILEGGQMTTNDSAISVKGARIATIYLSTATSFNGFDKSPAKQGKSPSSEASKNLARAVTRGFASLKNDH